MKIIIIFNSNMNKYDYYRIKQVSFFKLNFSYS